VHATFGECEIDAEARTLVREGRPVHLTPKAFDLLALLVRRGPAVVTKDEITGLLWPDTFVSEANLANLVAEVRQGLGEDARRPRFIRTVHRVGYAFQAPVSPASVAPPARCQLAGAFGVFELAGGDNLVGRSGECRVALGDVSVSRRHARIVVGETIVQVEDLHSRNGTFVDGIAVKGPAPLTHGAEVRFGSVRLTFREIDADLSTAGLEPPAPARPAPRSRPRT
jgi:DNA-binding winged helix-turn-helix (wHTH) protein